MSEILVKDILAFQSGFIKPCPFRYFHLDKDLGIVVDSGLGYDNRHFDPWGAFPQAKSIFPIRKFALLFAATTVIKNNVFPYRLDPDPDIRGLIPFKEESANFFIIFEDIDLYTDCFDTDILGRVQVTSNNDILSFSTNNIFQNNIAKFTSEFLETFNTSQSECVDEIDSLYALSSTRIYSKSDEDLCDADIFDLTDDPFGLRKEPTGAGGDFFQKADEGEELVVEGLFAKFVVSLFPITESNNSQNADIDVLRCYAAVPCECPGPCPPQADVKYIATAKKKFNSGNSGPTSIDIGEVEFPVSRINISDGGLICYQFVQIQQEDPGPIVSLEDNAYASTEISGTVSNPVEKHDITDEWYEEKRPTGFAGFNLPVWQGYVAAYNKENLNDFIVSSYDQVDIRVVGGDFPVTSDDVSIEAFFNGVDPEILEDRFLCPVCFKPDDIHGDDVVFDNSFRDDLLDDESPDVTISSDFFTINADSEESQERLHCATCREIEIKLTFSDIEVDSEHLACDGGDGGTLVFVRDPSDEECNDRDVPPRTGTDGIRTGANFERVLPPDEDFIFNSLNGSLVIRNVCNDVGSRMYEGGGFAGGQRMLLSGEFSSGDNRHMIIRHNEGLLGSFDQYCGECREILSSPFVIGSGINARGVTSEWNPTFRLEISPHETIIELRVGLISGGNVIRAFRASIENQGCPLPNSFEVSNQLSATDDNAIATLGTATVEIRKNFPP